MAGFKRALVVGCSGLCCNMYARERGDKGVTYIYLLDKYDLEGLSPLDYNIVVLTECRLSPSKLEAIRIAEHYGFNVTYK